MRFLSTGTKNSSTYLVELYPSGTQAEKDLIYPTKGWRIGERAHKKRSNKQSTK